MLRKGFVLLMKENS